MSNIQLKNVRILFPNLFHKKSFQEGQEGKYSASFLIPKDSKQGKQIVSMYKELEKEVLKTAKLKVIKENNVCLIDGDDSDYENNHGHWILKTSNKSLPKVLDREGASCGEDDITIKGGDYVYALISFWTYTGKYNGVSCNLHAVKFFKEGGAIGSADNSKFSNDDFDEFEDDDLDDEL